MNPPRLCATVTFELTVVANQPPVAPELTAILFEPGPHVYPVTFEDEGEVTFQVAPAAGQALPEWLEWRPESPGGFFQETLWFFIDDTAVNPAGGSCVVVTATDQGGLSASVVFAALLAADQGENPCLGVVPPPPGGRSAG